MFYQWHWYDYSSGQRGVYVSGTDNVVKNSSFQYSAGSGVILGGDNNRVTNCLFDHINYAATYDAAVYIEQGLNYSIDHNTIHDCGRSAIHRMLTLRSSGGW